MYYSVVKYIKYLLLVVKYIKYLLLVVEYIKHLLLTTAHILEGYEAARACATLPVAVDLGL